MGVTKDRGAIETAIAGSQPLDRMARYWLAMQPPEMLGLTMMVEQPMEWESIYDGNEIER